MATSKDEIRRWLIEARKQGATHVIVVCDTWDYEDYPVSVMPNEDVRQKFNEYSTMSMQRVMEVYALARDIDAQLQEHRAFHLD
jgi:hypothetical protein